jgi:chemotaxis protein MotA
MRVHARSGLLGGRLLGTATVAVLALLVGAALAGLLHPLSLLITLGGALTVTWITFSSAGVRGTLRQVSVALGDEPDAEGLVAIFKRLARIHRTDGAPALERASAEVADPFLRRAVALAVDTTDRDELDDTLAAEARRHLADGEAARHVLLTLGKLCPAFGLMGTLLGLALLLHRLGDADLPALAAALGLAVQTTLYGVVLSNVVVLPLATKLQAHLAARALVLQMIIDGTLLLHREEHPARIERALRAYVAADAAGSADPSLKLVPRAA